MENYKGKRNVTPAIAIKVFKENGKDISEDQAEKIIDFIYFLAELIVKQNPDIFKWVACKRFLLLKTHCTMFHKISIAIKQ